MKNKRFLIAGLALLLVLFPAGVFAKEATSIDTLPASTTVKAGESVTWTVTASYDDASTEDVSNFALFDIPDTAGGTLVANTYTSEKPGTYTIPVTVGEHSDTVSLTVVHDDPISLELTQSKTSIVAGSDSVSFTGKLVDSIGNTWDATGQMTLTSDDTKATVTSTSYTSTQAGTWTITASVGNLKASKQVTVTVDTASKIILDKNTTTLEKDKTTILSATVTDQYENPITTNVTWSSSATDFATVDADGKVTAIAAGNASITASFNGLLASSVVTVPAISDTTSATNTNTATEDQTNIDEGETLQSTQTDETDSVATTDADTSNDEACEQVALWVVIVILAVYALILLAYYTLIRREDDKSWWIFPALLTVIGIIIWNKYLCPDTVVWFPWVLLAVGLLLTGYGRGQMRKGGNGNSDTPPKMDEPQKPMF